MNRDEFQIYFDHFNNKRYEAVAEYFTPDVTVEYFDNPQIPDFKPITVHGRKAFIDQYKGWAEFTREVLEVGDFLSTKDIAFVELYTEFHFLKDVPDYFGKSMKKGEAVAMTNWVVYNLEKGKIKHIRIAHFRIHDPKTARL
ncbi:MAG: nuclear transport factor 2 family protein [Spirochaetes bacterium]|nr:nuclear transport factor 2 family protein [Spirochaetota bacterium]